MAGIGFELRKIFDNKGLISTIRGYFYSTIVTSGPFILIMTMLLVIQFMLKFYGKPYHYRELFIISVVYAFIFSQIFSAGFAMLITRFVADKLYSREYEEILPSILGILGIALFLGSMPAVFFFYFSPLDLELKLTTYVLYMELIIMWILTVYLSALKDYKKIIISFATGALTASILAFLVIRFAVISLMVGLLMAMDISILVAIVMLARNIEKFFVDRGSKHLVFLSWLEIYYQLFFINFFYTTALFIHNIIIWFSPLGRHIAGTYIYAPTYDVPTFFAFLSIIPVMAIFVVFVEINFYDKYKKYFYYITGKGNYTEIENSRTEMIEVIWHELTNLMELQLVFSFLALIIGNILLPKFALSYSALSIFNIMVLSAYLNGIMLVVIIILLYFEDRKGALLVAFIYFALNVSLNIICVKYFDTNTYGFGFFLAVFLSLVVAIYRVKYLLKNIDYFVFCSQPIFLSSKKGLLTKFLENVLKY